MRELVLLGPSHHGQRPRWPVISQMISPWGSRLGGVRIQYQEQILITISIEESRMIRDSSIDRVKSLFSKNQADNVMMKNVR